ncbi:hypothetical protein QE152_g39301 [Popillia japonica]|uniref:Uncharacterized protein n=1 Tax=Popillia japonica TaxID=7064 RepID=A0AAW1HU77_POPJA
MQEYTYGQANTKGKYNTNADALSRIKLNALETESVMNNAGDDTEDLLQDIQDILDTENFFEVPQQLIDEVIVPNEDTDTASEAENEEVIETAHSNQTEEPAQSIPSMDEAIDNKNPQYHFKNTYLNKINVSFNQNQEAKNLEIKCANWIELTKDTTAHVDSYSLEIENYIKIMNYNLLLVNKKFRQLLPKNRSKRGAINIAETINDVLEALITAFTFSKLEVFHPSLIEPDELLREILELEQNFNSQDLSIQPHIILQAQETSRKLKLPRLPNLNYTYQTAIKNSRVTVWNKFVAQIYKIYQKFIEVWKPYNMKKISITEEKEESNRNKRRFQPPYGRYGKPSLVATTPRRCFRLGPQELRSRQISRR